jgi:hypothetical protein
MRVIVGIVFLVAMILIGVGVQWKPLTARDDVARKRMLVTGIVILLLILVVLYWNLPWWVILLCLGFTVLVGSRVLVGLRR